MFSVLEKGRVSGVRTDEREDSYMKQESEWDIRLFSLQVFSVKCISDVSEQFLQRSEQQQQQYSRGNVAL